MKLAYDLPRAQRQDLTFVVKSEDAAVPTIHELVAPGSTIHADEAPHWDRLHARYLTKRINHSGVYSDGESCTTQAESFFMMKPVTLNILVTNWCNAECGHCCMNAGPRR